MNDPATAPLAPAAHHPHRDDVAGASAVAMMATALEAQQRALTLLADRVGGLCDILAKSGNVSQHMNSEEAARYLGRSVSWLLKRNDIAYVRGTPNVYRRRDLDAWVEGHLYKPRIG